MTGNIPPYYKSHEILNDIRNLFVNVETLALEYYKKTIMENDPKWVNLTDIFKGIVRYRDVIDSLEEKQDGERISREREDAIDDNFNKGWLALVIPFLILYLFGGLIYFIDFRCCMLYK